MTGHWLVKSEPGAYSWDDLAREGGTCWDGVRNAEARNHLGAMRADDAVLYYHSGAGREVVGVARVARTAYPDPSSDDERWVAVDLVPTRRLDAPVPLARIRADARLRKIPLVTRSRLSVMPLSKVAFERILELAGEPPRSSRGARVSRAGTRKRGRRRTRSSASRRAP